MKEYDFLFIQNASAFYKINLFNALADTCRVGVIFLGETNQVVMSKDMRQWKFDSYYLDKADLDRTNVIEVVVNAWKIWKLIQSFRYRYIVYGGWSNVEFVIMMFLTSRKKNCVISESSIYESATSGVKGFLKGLLINRNSHAFLSGCPHKELFLQLKYSGIIHITGGVGLALRNRMLAKREEYGEGRPLRYVYTGRVIEHKNVKLLIEAFNENGRQLTIIGKGDKEREYKTIAKPNISFLGFVENSRLAEIYANCDCLILPSKVEPWGLVVEEALYNGIPVIVSDMVGCNIDMVKNYDSGIVFDNRSVDSLQDAIKQMEQNYIHYRENAESIDWEKRDREQVDAFVNILKA